MPVDVDERPYYGRARTYGGLGALSVAGLLLLIDAFSAEYHVDSIHLGFLLGTALLLLGVEAGRRLLGGS